MQLCRTLAVFAFALTIASNAFSKNVYVNNLSGSDQFNGLSALRSDSGVGPVKSIGRALRIARFGDTVVIANTGQAYFESINLTGQRHSGNETIPFRILGNGATISGLRTVPPKAWTKHSDRLWSFEPYRKGQYMMFLNGEQLERAEAAFDQDTPMEQIPEGQFAVCRGRVFYSAKENDAVAEMDFTLAQGTTGISLYAVRNAIVQDLNVQHFRLDGVNAHDLCRRVEIRRLKSTTNARAGVTVAGSSQIVLRGCTVLGNAENSIRIEEYGGADVQESEVDLPPTVIGQNGLAMPAKLPEAPETPTDK